MTCIDGWAYNLRYTKIIHAIINFTMTSEKEMRFASTLCVTHDCNLNCIYCYQKHDKAKMSLDTAIKCIDWVFDNVPLNMDGIEIDFIGGEPLLEFELIKKIVAYTCDNKRSKDYKKFIFFATTNGTLLDDSMKKWLTDHKNCFCLGLSLDGTRGTHNFNRSNSFDHIDIDYFRTMWPEQPVKMTLSEYSLYHLAENVKYLHSLGFEVRGVNLFEGDFDWDDKKYVDILIPQLKELVDFYVENDSLPICQMFDRHLRFCESKNKERKKWCGIGTGCRFFDVDGKMYPCSFMTPMTFSEKELFEIAHIDFATDNDFIDEDCFNNCYIYPVCATCAGECYLVNKSFKVRDKRRCLIQKLVALFIADLQAKRILKNPDCLEKNQLYPTIEAIKKIKSLYYEEYQQYCQS